MNRIYITIKNGQVVNIQKDSNIKDVKVVIKDESSDFCAEYFLDETDDISSIDAAENTYI